MPKGRGRKGGRAPPTRKPSIGVDQRCKLSPSTSLQSNGHVEQTNINTANTCISTPTCMSINFTVPSAIYSGPVPGSSSFTSSPFTSSPSMVSPYGYPHNYSPPFMLFHPSQPCIDPTDAGRNPFHVAFIAGNISVCKGYKKDLRPPNDICILHEEWRTYMVKELNNPVLEMLMSMLHVSTWSGLASYLQC